MTNAFLEELCKKWGGKTSLCPFFEKNHNRAYLSINSLKFYTVCFNCMSRSRFKTLDFTPDKAFETMTATSETARISEKNVSNIILN